MKGALGQMMRQAQQMQENLKKAQDEVARLEVTGESGAGLVKVSLTGKYQARRVEAGEAMRSTTKWVRGVAAAKLLYET